MKNNLFFLLLFLSSFLFSQSLSIRDRKNKTIDLKIELPKNYELKICKNWKVEKTMSYVGTKYFNISNQFDYRLRYYDDIKNKIFYVYFYDLAHDIPNNLTNEYIIDLLEESQDRNIDDLNDDIDIIQDDRNNERH